MKGVNLRTDTRPGDIGNLIQLHGILYREEYGFDMTFEAYVARGMASFVLEYDPSSDRLWIAERGEKIIGGIAIVKTNESVAQLRWFFVLPAYRGNGIGNRLMSEAIEFCRQRKLKQVFLWTTSELIEAAHIYSKTGFVKTDFITHEIWGDVRTEEKYVLNLG